MRGLGELAARQGGSAFALDEFGPDFVPIIRTQVPAHDLALRCRFQRNAALDRDISLAVRPLMNQDGINAKNLSEPCLLAALAVYVVE